MAPYLAIPRDCLSDTPLLRAVGFLCLNMADRVRYPLGPRSPSPFPERFLLGSMRSGGAIPPLPPAKEVSQRYLRDTLYWAAKETPSAVKLRNKTFIISRSALRKRSLRTLIFFFLLLFGERGKESCFSQLNPQNPWERMEKRSKKQRNSLQQSGAREGGRTLRKGVFLPSKRLLGAFYNTPPF